MEARHGVATLTLTTCKLSLQHDSRERPAITRMGSVLCLAPYKRPDGQVRTQPCGECGGDPQRSMVANVGLAASVIESLHYDHYEGHAGFASGHHKLYA